MISDSIGYQKPAGTFITFIRILFNVTPKLSALNLQAHSNAQYADVT